MQDLKVIGVENGALLAASDDGTRFRIAIDEVLQSRLRQSRQESTQGVKVPPREIQAQIRSGLSAAEVVAITGAPLEYVERFVGPIMAEREHMVAQALSVPVRTSGEIDPTADPATFGVVIRERLASLGAVGERWASWRDEETGWIVKLAFAVDDIDHDARWSYEPRKHALTPLGPEAVTLSQQGELQGGLLPRLRAVAPVTPDDSRFDSGAFAFDEEAEPAAGPRAVDRLAPRAGTTVSNTIAVSAIKRSEEAPRDLHQTADLLEALRRRRGERESGDAARGLPLAPAPAATPPPGLPQLVDESAESVDRGDVPSSPSGEAPRLARRGRPSMPSWDEIVFGARGEDDPA